MVGSSSVFSAVLDVVVEVAVVVDVVVSDDEVVVSEGPTGGTPISVVDSGTLVVKLVVTSDGVMTNGCLLSREVAGATGVAAGVVTSVADGELHCPDICTTVTTSAPTRTAPKPPAAKVAAGVRYHGPPSDPLGSALLRAATAADLSPPSYARTLDDR